MKTIFFGNFIIFWYKVLWSEIIARAAAAADNSQRQKSKKKIENGPSLT